MLDVLYRDNEDFRILIHKGSEHTDRSHRDLLHSPDREIRFPGETPSHFGLNPTRNPSDSVEGGRYIMEQGDTTVRKSLADIVLLW